MSRSYKKPWVTDNNCSHQNKQISSRIERRTTKQIVKHFCKTQGMRDRTELCECIEEWDYEDDVTPLCICCTYPDYPEIPLRKELFNSYDICDFRFYIPVSEHCKNLKYYVRK